jgi:hypothetical protein
MVCNEARRWFPTRDSRISDVETAADDAGGDAGCGATAEASIAEGGTINDR